MSRYASPATPKQEGFINRLWRERANLDALDASQVRILECVKRSEVVSKDDASYLISGLLRCAQKPQGPMAQPGYYVTPGGTYLVVVSNKRGDGTYAKRLEVTKAPGQRGRAKWVYAPGEARQVANMTPMSLQKAAEFGHMYGVCFVCCRALTDPDSVKRGIGPVCAGKFGLVVPPKAQAKPEQAKAEEPKPVTEPDLFTEQAEPLINVAALRRRQRNR